MSIYTHPNCVFFEVASVIVDAIWMFEFSQESDFFENILPFFKRLFATIGHLFNGDHFGCDIVSSIIYSSETAVANFTEIIKKFVGVFTFKQ